MLQKAWGVFNVWRNLHFSLMLQNRTYSFSVLSIQNLVTSFFLEILHFFYIRKPWNAPSSHLILKMGKMGHFLLIFKHKKLGHFEEKHVTRFWYKEGPEMKSIGFGAFRRRMQLPSHDKILLHMLFGTFHGTSRAQLFNLAFDSRANKTNRLWHCP